MTDHAVIREVAHQARRDGRAVAAAESWPFTDHRPMSDILRAELAAAADRAGQRVNDAFDRAVRP